MNKIIFVLTLKSVFGGCRHDNTDLCESICSSNGGYYKCELRALISLPGDNFYESSLDKALPVFEVAEDFVYKSHLLPPFIRLKWLPQDTKCDSSLSIVNAMDGISKNCSHVMFGPLCDYPLGKILINFKHICCFCLKDRLCFVINILYIPFYLILINKYNSKN